MILEQVKTGLILDRLTPEAIAQNDVKPTHEAVEAELDKREEKAKQPPRLKLTLSPSELSMKGCDLELYFKFFPYDYSAIDPQPPATRRLWTKAAVLGDFLHQVWQAALAQSNAVHVANGSQVIESKVSELASAAKAHEIKQRGFTENMRIDLQVDEETSGEIKGIAAKDFDPTNRFFDSKLKVDQAQLYMYFLELKQTRYLAVNREASSYFGKLAVLEFRLTYDARYANNLLDKAERIRQAVIDGRPPKAQSPGTYYCKNLCNFKDYCPVGKTLV